MGISPSGATFFISKLYDGSISDKEIVARSDILVPRFWEEGDSCMADREFTIAGELKILNAVLNIPACMVGIAAWDQLTKAEVKKSQAITSVHIHVGRAVGRIKTLRLIRNQWTVTCLFCATFYHH